MTLDDALEELRGETSLRAQDVDDIRAAAASSQDDLILILRAYRDMGRAPSGPSFWERLGGILMKLPEYVGVAAAILKVATLV